MNATGWLLVIRGIVEGVGLIVKILNGGEPTEEELDAKFGRWEAAKEKWAEADPPVTD